MIWTRRSGDNRALGQCMQTEEAKHHTSHPSRWVYKNLRAASSIYNEDSRLEKNFDEESAITLMSYNEGLTLY